MAVLNAEEADFLISSSNDEEGVAYCNSIIRESSSEEEINYTFDHEIKTIDYEISQFNDDESYEDHMINMEIKEAPACVERRFTASTLSYEALQLLRHASRSLMKKKRQRRLVRRRRRVTELAIKAAGDIHHFDMLQDPHANQLSIKATSSMLAIRSAGEAAMKAADEAPTDAAGELVAMEAAGEVAIRDAEAPTCSRKHGNDDLVLLYKELQSLRSMIPSHIHGGDLDAEPCVVKDALTYLKFLKQEMKSLKEGLIKPLESRMRTCFDAQVDVKLCTTERLEVKVSCKKRVGLLAELMVVFQSHGLIFDSFDASYHQWLLLQATSTQKGIHFMDMQAIRRAILMTIYKK
eukprot:c23351_g1_i1 orf=1208-2257(+)